jgi:uncharacterized protein
VRRWRSILLVLVLLALVFHAGGAWYFSDQLREDALTVRPPDDDPDVVVTEVGPGTVGLRVVDGEDPDLTDPGVMGLSWETGYGQLLDIESTNPDGMVVRRLVRIEGALPEVGNITDLDGFAFPPDPSRAFGLSFRETLYPSPLGDMGAWEVLASSKTWVIHVHGLRASRAEALRLVGPVARFGHPQLVINYRNDDGQPADPSGQYQYGATEWEDVAAAVDFVMARGAENAVLIGYSTGAAHVLSYLYQTPETPVIAAILDSPNIDFEATVDLGASQRRLPFVPLSLPGTLVWAAKRVSSIRFGLDWRALDYVARASELTRPLLIFHGTADETVPFATSQELAAARSDLVRLVVVTSADHVRSWNVGPDDYERRVEEFLSEITGS